MTWLEQYESNELETWLRLTALPADLAGGFDEVMPVALETMNRVKSNLEMLIEGLTIAGFEFEEEPLVPPSNDAKDQLAELIAACGPIPLSLQAFFLTVGSVCFIGSSENMDDWETWSEVTTDPLVVSGIDQVLDNWADFAALGEEDGEEEGEENNDENADDGENGDRVLPFFAELSPDWHHKDDVSGGQSYSMALPNNAHDGLFLFEPHLTTFVNYLRIATFWAGFPGFEFPAGPGTPRSTKVPEFIVELRSKLITF